MDQKSIPGDAGDRPPEVLQALINVFSNKGLLNQALRIMHRDRRYRIYCSETEFIAHRINDNCAVSWGFPCWAVCIVTRDQIIEDADLSMFSSAELSAREWFRCIADGDFQLL